VRILQENLVLSTWILGSVISDYAVFYGDISFILSSAIRGSKRPISEVLSLYGISGSRTFILVFTLPTTKHK